MEELIKYIKALLLVQIHTASVDGDDMKPEVMLSRAGLRHAEIADLLGKKAPAVAKVISRAK